MTNEFKLTNSIYIQWVLTYKKDWFWFDLQVHIKTCFGFMWTLKSDLVLNLETHRGQWKSYGSQSQLDPPRLPSQPSVSYSKSSLKHFHWSSWTTVVWHFKESLKVKFLSQDLHCTLCVSKSKMKSDFKVHIKTKHARLLFMLQFNVNLKIRFSFDFGNTQRTLEILWKPMVVMWRKLKVNLSWMHTYQERIFLKEGFLLRG